MMVITTLGFTPMNIGPIVKKLMFFIEVFVEDKLNSEPCLLEIRKLAASCQQGEPFISVKTKVDNVISSFKKKIGMNPEIQAERWTILFNSLGRFLNNNSAPEWVRVIRYARKIINYKKHHALYRIRHMSAPEKSSDKGNG